MRAMLKKSGTGRRLWKKALTLAACICKQIATPTLRARTKQEFLLGEEQAVLLSTCLGSGLLCTSTNRAEAINSTILWKKAFTLERDTVFIEYSFRTSTG